MASLQDEFDLLSSDPDVHHIQALVEDLDLEHLGTLLRQAGYVGVSQLRGGELRRYLNSVHGQAETDVERRLASLDSVLLVHYAMLQLQVWTHRYLDLRGDIGDELARWAPVGRMGWRYVVERLLATWGDNSLFVPEPGFEDMRALFTDVVVLSLTSEWSDALNFFPELTSSAYVDASNSSSALDVRLSEEQWVEFERWVRYSQGPRGTNNPEWTYAKFETTCLRRHLDEAFRSEWGVAWSDLGAIADALIASIGSRNPIPLIAESEEELSVRASVATRLDLKTCRSAVRLMLLRPETAAVHGERKFHRRVHPVRLIDYAGLSLPHFTRRERLFGDAAHVRTVATASRFAVTSMVLLHEWRELFPNWIANDQRRDGRGSKQFQRALSRASDAFHREVIECGVADMLRSRGAKVVKSLVRLPGTARAELPCGEIDILALHPETRTMLVVEVKSNAMPVDWRTRSKQRRDHFHEKNYHGKFLKKISWVCDNIPPVLRMFGEDDAPIRVRSLFVTRCPYIPSLMTDDYEFATIEQLQREFAW